MLFPYGQKELDHLKSRDPELGRIIDKLGFLERETDSDLFASVVHHIAGQQISMKAQATIWRRITEGLGTVDSRSVCAAPAELLRSFGLSERKVEYIKDFAAKVESGEFDLAAVEAMSDDEAVAALSSLKGIGVWTAEMILLFSLKRPDVLSFGDLAIQKGLRMIHHHRRITPELFRKYKRRYSPYCSTASFYIWAAANGLVDGLKDYAPASKTTKRVSGKKSS